MQSFTWNGEAMIPTRLLAAVKAYTPGRRYWLEEVSDRSWFSHRHEFAWIAEAWNNLPEALAETFPTPEHLRKAALIATGWHREMIIEAGSAAAALRVAAYAKGRDEFAHVVTRGPTVTVRWARSSACMATTAWTRPSSSSRRTTSWAGSRTCSASSLSNWGAWDDGTAPH